MRTFYIGDVHGCLHEFQELVRRLHITPHDHVVCLGDFLDKGPYGAECVIWAMEQGFTSILGNHEERVLRWLTHEGRVRDDPTYTNPMTPLTPIDMEQLARLKPVHCAWLRGLPLLHHGIGGCVAVHGGLQPGVPLADQKPSKVLRMRWVDRWDGEPKPTDYNAHEKGPVGPPTPGVRHPTYQPEGSVHWTERYDGPHPVVYGHEAHRLSEPWITRHTPGGPTYGIDTGCVHGGHLTAMIAEVPDELVGLYKTVTHAGVTTLQPVDGHEPFPWDAMHVSFEQVRAQRVYQEPLEEIPW